MKIQDIRFIELSGKHDGKLGVRMPGGFAIFKTTMIFAYEKLIAWRKRKSCASSIDPTTCKGWIDKRSLYPHYSTVACFCCIAFNKEFHHAKS